MRLEIADLALVRQIDGGEADALTIDAARDAPEIVAPTDDDGAIGALKGGRQGVLGAVRLRPSGRPRRPTKIQLSGPVRLADTGRELRLLP